MLWSLGTVGHFILTAHWLKRAASASSRDESWFQTMVTGTGTLLIALHLVSSTVGLSIGGVLAVLAAGHAVAWYVGRPFTPRRTRGGAELARLKPRPTAVAPHDNLPTRVLELAAVVFLTAIVIQWALLALVDAGVSGSDAAHYHVPNAVNLALGASPFDLPATSHLYPMASSTLAAWFLLPVQTTLLTDLVMVLPFLLVVSAAGWLFRQLTSISGLAWSTWMMLALFSTPLFRTASLMSADLLFTGATLAFGASLLAPLLRRQLKQADVWFIALSLGLLLGSKVTGVVAAVLLGGPALVALAVGRWRARASARAESSRAKARDLQTAWVYAGAAIAVIGAGGIWLVRNWWVWGSPVAPNGVTLFGFTLFPGNPYAASNYLSVLGDIAETNNYQPWTRARHFTDVWLSSWYLLGLGALALIPVDAIASRSRGITSQARLWTMLIACGTGAVLASFLIGAPWTSLEWTRGFSLRYALPWLALLPLVSWTGMFPASLPWYRYTPVAAVAGLVIATGSVALFAGDHAISHPPFPTWQVLLTATLVTGAPYALQLANPLWRTLLIGGVIVRSAVLFDTWTAQADARAQEAGTAAIAGGQRSRAEQIYDAAITFETTDPRSCDAQGRRFFVTNRFDEAGALQGARLANQVFYAARDVRVTASVRPPMGNCDYLITERAVMGTDKGAALHAALNPSGRLVEVATVGDVVLLVHR
jgi:hypothetical protein